MKSRNRFSMVLGICFVVADLFLSINLNAQSIFDYEGITYRVIKDADEASTFGTVAVTEKSDGFYEGTIVIPNAVKQLDDAYADTYKVITIDDEAFKGCPNLEEVRLPISVESIGTMAFSECPRLKRIEIPEGNLNDLGSGTFISSGLESISIPNGVTEIEFNTFRECRNLTQVVLPETLKKIKGCAFMYCQSLKSIELPKGLREIDVCAFAYCGLKRISLPNKLITISLSAFSCCFDLEEVELSPYTTSIGSAAFSYCWQLSKINYPESLKFIDEHAFDGCMNLPDSFHEADSFEGLDEEVIEGIIREMKTQSWK